MPKPKKTCSIRTICHRAKIPAHHAEAFFREIIEATLQGEAVSVPTCGSFWIQRYGHRKMRVPVPGSTSTLKTITAPPTYALRFSSSPILREHLRRRHAGRARGTA